MKKWFPCFAYAFKIGANGTDFSVKFGYVSAVDAGSARQIALDNSLAVHPTIEGWTDHDVAVLNFPEFTTVKEGE